MRLRFALWMVVAVAGSLSCSNRVTAPVVLHAEDIRFELAKTGGGSPGDPITFVGRVHNAGSASVFPFSSCPDPYIRIYDTNQVELHQADPTQPVPCPLALIAPLEPGKTIEFSLTFDGHYFSDTGILSTAPAGTYRAIATFRYSPPEPSGTSDLHGVTREISFDWQ
jgi:hypothetical protein